MCVYYTKKKYMKFFIMWIFLLHNYLLVKECHKLTINNIKKYASKYIKINELIDYTIFLLLTLSTDCILHPALLMLVLH